MGDVVLIDARKQQLLDWLLLAPSERRPASLKGLAEVIGVSVETLHAWKRDEGFRRVWQQAADQVVGSPERTQAVLDKLYEGAVRGDVKAASLYLQALGKMQPQRVEVSTSSQVERLSDEELDLAIREGLAAVRGRRVGSG